ERASLERELPHKLYVLMSAKLFFLISFFFYKVLKISLIVCIAQHIYGQVYNLFQINYFRYVYIQFSCDYNIRHFK
ncbi:OR2M2 isoform 1, partial [Pongo abelii]